VGRGEQATIGWRTITNVNMSIAIRQYCTSQYIILQCQRRLISASAAASLQHKLCTNHGCPQQPSLSRYHSSDSSSSNGKQLSKKDSTATSSNQITHDKQTYNKRRRKRSSSSSYSLLQQQYKQLPQTTNENRILTRRELIRLSPKQRTIYHAKRLQQYKDSQSYLDQARTNVRSNIKFLSETADTNFKKNISTIKRLFNGEEVDSVIAEQPKISTTKSAKRQQKLKSKKEEEESLTNGIDWERAPAEIKANFQSNIASIQNWLHQVSDGKIPSSTYSNSSSTSVEHPSGSVANRISKFHQLKQSNELVMDNKWIFKNILLALLPGTLFHLYFQSLQGEMREYYDRVEQDERDKILGYRGEAGVVDTSGSDDDESSSTTNVDIGSKESDSSSGKAGLSSAFSITEGENAWEKLKIVVSDLFLGGVEEKISRHRSKQQKQENGEQDDSVVETTNNQPTSSVLPSDVPENNSSLPADTSSTTPNKDLDPTIQTLLHRIEALEQQLGTTSTSTKLKEDLHKKQEQQEQRQKEHQLKRRIERLRQSAIQNRREDKLEAEWREEEANKKKSKVHAQNNIQDEDDESSSSSSSSSFLFWDVMNFTKSMIELSIESTQASLKQKIKEVFDTFVDESGGSSVDEEVISSALDSTEQPREADVVSIVVSADASDLTNTDSIKNEIQQESNPDSTSGGSLRLRRWIGKLWKPKPTPDI